MTRKTIDQLLREARGRLDRLEPKEAFAAKEKGALLIDTRSSDERTRTGVIPGSVHIPLSVLHWRVDPDVETAYRNPHVEGTDQRLVVVCAHGYSSSLAAATLQELGFSHATDLVGGFSAWKEQGFPVVPAPNVDSDMLAGTGPPEP